MPASEGLPLTLVTELRTAFLDAARSYHADSGSGGNTPRSETASRPDATCPICFQVLPRSGVCDYC